MDYKSALKNFRRQLEVSQMEEPRVKRGSFFTPPAQQFQQVNADNRTAEDFMAINRDWVQQIRQSSAEVKEKMKVTDKTKEQGFVDGLASSLKPSGKEISEMEPEERKTALIQKRESPSAYAPERPKETVERIKTNPEGAKGFLGLMDQKEGGGNYDTLFGHSQKEGKAFSGKKVSEMTIGELKEFTNPSGSYGQWVKSKVGRVATPMGRYQIVGSTLKQTAKEMGLSDDTVFDKNTQDAMFNHILGKAISGGKTMDEKVKRVKGQWEGFNSVPKATLAAMIEDWENKNA